MHGRRVWYSVLISESAFPVNRQRSWPYSAWRLILYSRDSPIPKENLSSICVAESDRWLLLVDEFHRFQDSKVALRRRYLLVVLPNRRILSTSRLLYRNVWCQIVRYNLETHFRVIQHLASSTTKVWAGRLPYCCPKLSVFHVFIY